MDAKTDNTWKRNVPIDLSAAGVNATLAVTVNNRSEERISLDELKKLVGVLPGLSMSELNRISTIGIGGMGAVFSAHEPVLNREIAIKILRTDFQKNRNAVVDFIREARITAQIDHPNVIPVHRLGVFDDSGVYFTMKKVEGVTLSYILKKLKEGDPEMRRLYTRRRLLGIFAAVCNGVAFAHSKGIIHRDLKPLNIMVGDYGEVFVMDWGLAVYRAENDRSFPARKIEIGELPDEEKNTKNSAEEPGASDSGKSKKDKLSGTPAFIAPELLSGGKADELSDIYALGAILYAILTHEQSPFEEGLPVDDLLKKVAVGNFLRPRRRARRLKIPHELEAITLKAMAHNAHKRYESVEKLLEDVRNYQDKFPVSAYSPLLWYRTYKLIRRRPLVPLVTLAALLTLGAWNGFDAVRDLLMARALFADAAEQIEQSETLRTQVIGSHKRLNDIYQSIGTTDAVDGTLIARANVVRLSDEYEILCNSASEKLRKILELKVGHERTIAMLAKLFTDQFRYAFITDDQPLEEQLVAQIRSMRKGVSKRLFAAQPKLEDFIKIVEQNQGELVVKNQFEWLDLSAIPANSGERVALKFAPEKNMLKSGSYTILARLKEPGEAPTNELMRFPVVVERGRTEELALEFPELRPSGMIYIPGGSFIFGNRMADEHSARTRLDGYYISRHEVTFAEYLEFWKSLTDEAERSRFTGYGEKREPMRKIEPLWDAHGTLHADLDLQMPIIGITPEAAEAYCKWKSRQTGLNYRLPTALEWEKAARGVDGREYVWGDEWTFGNANTAAENGGSGTPAKVETFAQDYSVYGVYDMAGNAREVVKGSGGDTPYMVKGGGFASPRRFARIAENAYETTLPDLGFRCVVELPKKAEH